MKKIFFQLAFVLGVNLPISHSQEVIATSGGLANGSGGNVSYSVGQVLYSFSQGQTGSVEQGVQHAYEIYPVGIDEKMYLVPEISVYPNPTAETIILQVDFFEKNKLTYIILDAKGHLLTSKPIESIQTSIILGDVPSGTYFVQICQEKHHIKTFKIIKSETK